MQISPKAAVAVLLATAAFAWHQIPGSAARESSAAKIVLDTRTVAEPRTRRATPQLRLPGPPSAKSAKGTAAPAAACPKENYHEIMSYYAKNNWNVCVDMKSVALLEGEGDTYFRAEVERLSSPLLGPKDEHRYRLSLTQLDGKNADRGTLIFNDTVTIDRMYLYPGNLREFVGGKYEDLLENANQTKTDTDSLCFNPETREYSRMLTGNYGQSGGRFLSRAELNLKDGSRLGVVCREPNSCTCTPKRTKMRVGR